MLVPVYRWKLTEFLRIAGTSVSLRMLEPIS